MSLDFSLEKVKPVEVYTANITHNLSPMWRKAGVYVSLYESDGEPAVKHLPALRAGLQKMLADPKGYRELDPYNGWGDYDAAVLWLTAILRGIELHHDATIRISK